MSVCRDISKCCEEVQEKHKLFMAECKKEGLDVDVIETFRSNEVQTAYYSQGRADLKTVNDRRVKAGLSSITEKDNHVITNTKAGMSKHNSGKAVDYAPRKGGVICWNDSSLFFKMGQIGKRVGFTWGIVTGKQIGRAHV